MEGEFWVWAFMGKEMQAAYAIPVLVMVGKEQQTVWLHECDAGRFHMATVEVLIISIGSSRELPG